MPTGTMPNFCPASYTMSHNRAPCSNGTYNSQPSSPTYEMREASACTVPKSTHLHVPNGNASFEKSVSLMDWTSSRDLGPHTPSVDHADVTSVNVTLPSSGKWSMSHFLSRAPSNAPVTTRKYFSPSR